MQMVAISTTNSRKQPNKKTPPVGGVFLLQQTVGLLSEGRALDTDEVHAREVLLATETIDEHRETRGLGSEIRIVDLRGIAEQNDLRTIARTGDQGLQLARRQILRLVQDDELVLERATTHEADGLEMHRFDELTTRLRPLSARNDTFGRDHFDVVGDRAHPRKDLLAFITGQETDLFAERDERSSGDDVIGLLRNEHAVETSSECEQGFARARLAREGNEVDLGIEKHVHGEILLEALGFHPEKIFAIGVLLEGVEDDVVIADLPDDAIEWLTIMLDHDELVDAHGNAHIAKLEAFDVADARLADLHVRIVPEVRPEDVLGTLQRVEFVFDTLSGVVLARKTEDAALDEDVVVLRDKDNAVAFEARIGLEVENGLDDEVVVDLARRRHGQRHLRIHLREVELARTGSTELDEVERDAILGLATLGIVLLDELPDEARSSARFVARSAIARLESIEFLDDRERDADIVLIEVEEREGVVNEDVRVQSEDRLLRLCLRWNTCGFRHG